MKNDLLMIGELAKTMNVSVRTLQYYDKEDLLKPSALSKGGRRLYSSKDVVKLYQILSMKSLGFQLDEIRTMLLSLDTPAQVAEILEKQNRQITGRIVELKRVSDMITSLHEEVLQMDRVDFEKYADIVSQLKNDNKFYWVLKLLDEKLIEHTEQHFGKQPELGMQILDTYSSILDEAVALHDLGEPPQSEASICIARKWWDMVLQFTNGDMSLIPKLMEFNDDKTGWDKEIAQKQKQVDGYIGEALMHYFSQNGISIPEMEEEKK